MKDIELRLISELMKNSRRSDRELARVLGTSQPTVSRLLRKLEKQGIIKEYTMIPDFRKLGYQIMAFTFATFRRVLEKPELENLRQRTTKLDRDNPHASLMAVNGAGLGKNRAFITFYENYSAYLNAMTLTKQIPEMESSNIESFLIDLNDESHYRLLTLSAIAKHLLISKEKTQENTNPAHTPNEKPNPKHENTIQTKHQKAYA